MTATTSLVAIFRNTKIEIHLLHRLRSSVNVHVTSRRLCSASGACSRQVPSAELYFLNSRMRKPTATREVAAFGLTAGSSHKWNHPSTWTRSIQPAQSHEPFRGSGNATLNESRVLDDQGALSDLGIYLLSRCPRFVGQGVQVNSANSCLITIYSRGDVVPRIDFCFLAVSGALRVRPRKSITKSSSPSR